MNSTIVETATGRVEGARWGGAHVWRGIPFAKAPVGKLRFRAPEPHEGWAGVREAVQPGGAGQQPLGMMRFATFTRERGRIRYGEDCLTLNIYSPGADGKKRPVMFWIHGGGYFGGSASQYDGSRLAQEGDAVVVTANYRLGFLGFMHFSDLAPGRFESNLGTRDQIAALRWVRENIAAFGGDPENITIFGESAGGSSVCNLLAAPAARGLFHRAIAQSPGAAHGHDRERAREMAVSYLSHLGLGPADAPKLLDMPAARLYAPFNKYVTHIANEVTGALAFAPLVGDDVLPHAPIDAVAAGHAKGVPVVIGTNRHEMTLFAHAYPPLLPTNAKRLELWLNGVAPHAKERIWAAYGHPKGRAVLSMARDGVFAIPALRIAESQAPHAKVWMYRFDWMSPLLKRLGMGATHAAELPFVFNQFDSITGRLLTNVADPRRRDALGRRMRAAWVRFARQGEPGADGGDWPRYAPEAGRQTRIFDHADRIESDPNRHYREAWHGVFEPHKNRT